MSMDMVKKYSKLDDAIRDICGPGRQIIKRRFVSGGDINEACSLETDDGTIIFMKSNRPSFFDNFMAEAEGLEAIRSTKAIGLPRVLGIGREKGFSFLLLEYISGKPRIEGYWEQFALELANMHKADIGETYGFFQDNWIGSGRQVNTPCHSWIDFFRDYRLVPQFDAAQRYFSAGQRRKMEYLLSHLDRYLMEPDRPSLVHGDLWSGNMITGNDGKGWLIDPAVYYGHAEVDIAMTELFGGFPRSFYEAYRDVGKMDAGYHDRRDLYNLYHLLNHLNIFGGGYLSSVLRIVDRYS